MKAILALCLLLATSEITLGQVAPSASAGKAELDYSFRYSEIANFGDVLGDWHTITPSGSLSYLNGRTKFPFHLEYAGGYTFTISGPPYSSGAFQHLFLSQDLHYRKWTFTASDDVSYRPQSPTTGFSGIPGIGEPIGSGNTSPPNQTILTLNTHVLENFGAGRLEHSLNYRTKLNIETSLDYLHYPDGNGLDTKSAMAQAGVDLRLNSRNSLITEAAFSRFTYPGYGFHLTTDTVRFGFHRAWTRSFQVNASAGPEWVTTAGSTIQSPLTRASVQAGFNYELRQTSAFLSYFQGTSGGSGYMVGSQSKAVSAGFAREFNRSISFETSSGYYHNSAIVSPSDISGIFGGVQMSWQIGRSLNTFLNYTVTSQRAGMHLPSNVQDQVINAISCGIGFTKKTRRVQ
jgi:hypothetical protein